LIAIDEPLPWSVTSTSSGQKSKAVFARLPHNGGKITNFPHAEMVLMNTKTSGVPPEGWGPIESAPGFDSSKVHFWEYNTMDMAAKPIDMSRRHAVAKRLKLPDDAKKISDYSRPEFVLDGWKPVIE
jgi:pectinesterase